jgi:hypothetical protein
MPSREFVAVLAVPIGDLIEHGRNALSPQQVVFSRRRASPTSPCLRSSLWSGNQISSDGHYAPHDCRKQDVPPPQKPTYFERAGWYRRGRDPRYQRGSDLQGGCREVEVRTGSPLGTGHLKTAELWLEGAGCCRA